MISIAAVCTAFGQSPPTELTEHPPEGLTIYSPTRIEWLVLWASATLRSDNLLRDMKFMINFREGVDPNTIEVVVGHLRDVDRSLMNTVVERSLKDLRDYARKKGWAWLKVKEVYWKISDSE